MLIIQKDKYSRADIEKNLLSWYNYDRTNGADWYDQTQQFCIKLSEKYKVHFVQVAGIIAALSPQKNWDINKRLAIDFLESGRAGQYKFLVDKARRILNSENLADIPDILHGRKIRSFFLNIIGYSRVVTIDRHIISAAVGYSYGTITEKGYGYLESIIVNLAYIYHVEPKVFQAVVWSNYRDVNVRKFEEKVPF
jgi:hypothetical protein